MKYTTHNRKGYTLTEVLVASAISGIVLTLAFMVYGNSVRVWRGFEMRASADNTLNLALNNMVYGVDSNLGLRAADSRNTTITASSNSWKIDYETGYPVQNSSFEWSKTTKQVVFKPGNKTIATDVAASTVSKIGAALTITMRVEKTKNKIKAVREASTVVYLRN